MGRYNLKPSLADHCHVLIIVRPVSTNKISEKEVNYVMNLLSNFQFVRVHGTSRILQLKFVRSYSKESSSWGTMQLHRRPSGLIGIGKLSEKTDKHNEELKGISMQFDNMKSQYLSRVDEFKCFILGPKERNFKIVRSDQLYLDGTTQSITHESEVYAFMNEFISYLFIGLESKRVEKANEKLDNMQLPIAPIEQEQTVSDTDTRFKKRKCLGRNKKLLADICLMSAMYQEALYYYTNAAEHLRAVNDYLWMGAAIEGACATTYVMTRSVLPHLESVLCELTSKTSNGCQMDPSEAAKMRTFTPLSNDDLIAKYSEAIGYYKRFQTFAVELEAHLKLAQLLIGMNKRLETCQVLQSLLALRMNYNEDERIELYIVVASFYDKLNLLRKASFFKRLGSIQCSQSPNTDIIALDQANTLLEYACPGYSLHLKSRRRQDNVLLHGWPSVQMRVLLDLLHLSRKLGNTVNSIRIICYLLEGYHSVLPDDKMVDLVSLLEDFSCQLMEDNKSQNEIPKHTELIWPLPKVRNVRPRQPPHYLRPIKSYLNSPDLGGPFIFSSLSFQSKTKGKNDVEDVRWVCNELLEVGMTVDNPLPAEIKVDKMKLLTEGIKFKASDGKLALPAESGSFPFMLLGTPEEPGQLILQGFEVEVFGIRNNVLFDKPITVNVTQPLALMQLSSSLPTQLVHTKHEDADHRALFTSLSLYRGHSYAAHVTLENCGRIPIHEVFIKLSQEKDAAISFHQESLEQQLPIEPQGTATLSLLVMPSHVWKLHAKADKIRATLTFTYSGASNGQEEYGREISMVVDIKVMPSLNIVNFDVYKFDRHTTCCCLCFDAQNLTSVPMHVSAIVNCTEDIKPLPKCSNGPKLDIPPKGTLRVGLHSPRFSLRPPEQRRRETLEDTYARAIAEAVDVKWHLSESDYDGVAFLSGIKITKDMIKVLKPEHLSMDISMDNVKTEEGRRIDIPVFKMTTIQVQLKNMHDYDLENLLLNVQAFPEHRHMTDVSPQLVAWHGVHTKAIKRLSPGETYDHSCGMLFLFTGYFQVDISCSVERHISGGVLKRSRAQAIISDRTPMEVPTIDNIESEYVVIDGVITQPKTHEDILENRLQKPISNYWVHSLKINVPE